MTAASEHSSLNRAGARGVQSGGGPRTHAHLDRDAARVVVRRFVSPYLVEEDEETVIAAFEGCVVQPAPQTIDRDALNRLLAAHLLPGSPSTDMRDLSDAILGLVQSEATS